eukprot:CAMPEP_0172487944 /NCGR_PEP_ID=MMETSP1066-20121228/17251_1 /TAXON_ID=671091 /ORGANISM="Coscinodiscus wailesii, Strain CCMP2513" /LENGTH=460 /DNA_ID=CAMNT_0013254869 /DNA_START=52 /DNA_END=1430 /DNA_ORIENTATION=+
MYKQTWNRLINFAIHALPWTRSKASDRHDRLGGQEIQFSTKNQLIIRTHDNDPRKNLFELDIMPTWRAIVTAYGEDVANRLVDDGTMTKQANTTGEMYDYESIRWDYRDPADGKVVVPYVFSDDFDDIGKCAVNEARLSLEKRLGYVKFVPRSDEEDFIRYSQRDPDDCWSYLGRIGGQQEMNLGWCANLSYEGAIIHEHLHALGISHEYLRPDRDRYIKMHFKNTDPHDRYTSHQKVPYNYQFLMHYDKGAIGNSSHAISATLDRIDDNTMGHKYNVSDLDVQRVRLCYQCQSKVRTLAEKQLEPCLIDCPCAMMETGCRLEGVDQNNRCLPGLSCENDVCLKQATSLASASSKNIDDVSDVRSLSQSANNPSPTVSPTINVPTVSQQQSDFPSFADTSLPNRVLKSMANLSGHVNGKPVAYVPGYFNEERVANLPGHLNEKPVANVSGYFNEEPVANL